MQSDCWVLACIASVSVGLGSKERPRKGTGTVFCPRKIGARVKIRKRGWERGRKEMLADKPLDFENLVSGWTSQTLFTCVNHRIKKGNCSLFTKISRQTSRELRQHGGNPVVQCWRFGISKRNSATLFSFLSFTDVWSLACLNSKDFPLFVLSQAITHATISSLWHVS